MNSKNKRVVLCILDGWGYSENRDHNAWFAAKTTHFDTLFAKCPNTLLDASGNHVGLPEEQMGNSEVGHMTIGSGRIILQDLERINEAIANGSFKKNYIFDKICTVNNSRNFHILGLLSDGGVHSHVNHIIEIAKIIYNKAENKSKIYIHAILDGRDTNFKSAIKYIEMIEVALNKISSKNRDIAIQIATIAGRYYAMDRDDRYEKTEKAANAILAKDPSVIIKNTPNAFINEQYEKGITDEFIEPVRMQSYNGIENNDVLVVTNFRADRIKQIIRVISDKFEEHVYMTHYSDDINNKANTYTLFEQTVPVNTLGEVLAANSKRQLRVAETEKYAHVTSFLNGGREELFELEDRILINSPIVHTYDLMPEMSAKEVTDAVIGNMRMKQYDFICVNFANLDMVGHTGHFEAAIKACEFIDVCVKRITDELDDDTVLLITSDHGNVEEMYDIEMQTKHTAHSVNPVPIVYVTKKLLAANNNISDIKDNIKERISISKKKHEFGGLRDIAPTVLYIMNIDKPEEMSGDTLFVNE